MPSKSLDSETYKGIAEFVHSLTGLVLGPEKVALVTNRLQSRVDELGLPDYASYFQHVERDTSGKEVSNMVNALTTNTTSFFREPDQFVFMRDVMERWVEEGQRKFRIWSAASSTGEEPYSIAMVLNDVLDKTICSSAGHVNASDKEEEKWDIKILCTDIDSIALGISREGWYASRKLQDIRLPMPMRFFSQVRRAHGGSEMRIASSLQEYCVFARLNLMNTPYKMKGPFDLIFCRNVMIYFDNELRRRILGEMHRLLRDDGYLFVGSAEALVGILSGFRLVQSSIYEK